MKIKTFETVLNKPAKVSVQQITEFRESPPLQRNSGRKYEATNRVVYVKWLAHTFEENEFKAYEKQAMTNEEIQAELLARFPRNLYIRSRFKTYKATIGMYRKKYNQQLLYAAQPAPYFLSFQYDPNGYIVIGGMHPTAYMSFEACYKRCLEFKVADPRFVQHEYIVEIRNRQTEMLLSKKKPKDGDEDWLKWIVPNEDIIKRLGTKLHVKELYNSVRFHIGWTREETPVEDEED